MMEHPPLAGLRDALRGARHLRLYAVVALVGILGMLWLNGVGAPSGPEKTPLEARLERLLGQIDGAGKVSAMVVQDEQGGVTGAVIVVDRIRDMRTYLKLQTSVQALLDVGLDRIRIIPGKGEIGDEIDGAHADQGLAGRLDAGGDAVQRGHLPAD